MNKHWQIEEITKHPEEFLAAAQKEGAQYVTENGVATAVLMPLNPSPKTEGKKYRDIKEWLLAPEARTENLVPPRSYYFGSASKDDE